MLDKESITTQTPTKTVSLEISEDKRRIRIFHDNLLIANFRIQEVWDMLINAAAMLKVSPTKEPGLYRRKGEALAGLLYTHKNTSKPRRRRMFVPTNPKRRIR